MKIRDIAFTGYPVTDLQRARDFYETVLGLIPSWIHDKGEEGSWIEYELGSRTFAISNIAKDWKPSSDGPSIAFEVEDFDSTIAELQSQHVKFAIEPLTTEVCRMALITDPDGNLLIIHKLYS
jgi:catechol 2,3-dioxygenase-like lactoylglutathione lyase family enzyme